MQQNKPNKSWCELIIIDLIHYVLYHKEESLKMQTRISVYKLYTKSKALYIQIHKAAVSLLIRVKHLNYNSSLCYQELSKSESLQQFNTVKQHELPTWSDSIQTLYTEKRQIFL